MTLKIDDANHHDVEDNDKANHYAAEGNDDVNHHDAEDDDDHDTNSSSHARTAALEPRAQETSKTPMFSMTTRCLVCQGFALNI